MKERSFPAFTLLRSKPAMLVTLLAAVALVVAACGGGEDPTAAPTEAMMPKEDLGSLSGDVDIDGSSTVFPISEAVAEGVPQRGAEGPRAGGRLRHGRRLQALLRRRDRHLRRLAPHQGLRA